MTAMVDIDTPAEVELPALQVRIRREGLRPTLLPRDGAAWIAALGRLLGKGDQVEAEVIFRRPKKRQSDAARGYLWGIVYYDILTQLRARAVEVGERCPFDDKDDVHQAFKYMILGTRVERVAGQDVEIPATTTVFDSAGLSTYISQVKRIAAERWSIYCREPYEDMRL